MSEVDLSRLDTLYGRWEFSETDRTPGWEGRADMAFGEYAEEVVRAFPEISRTMHAMYHSPANPGPTYVTYKFINPPKARNKGRKKKRVPCRSET